MDGYYSMIPNIPLLYQMDGYTKNGWLLFHDSKYTIIIPNMVGYTQIAGYWPINIISGYSLKNI